MRDGCLSLYPTLPVLLGAVVLMTPLVGVGSSWHSGGGSAAAVGATSQACVYEGHLQTDKNWYGYLANITVMTTGRLTFEFIYPADKCCQNVLFYSQDQMAVINARMNCWQKEYPLRPEDDQILRLTPRFAWSGCHKTYPNNVAMYICKGGRSFTVDHQRHQYGGQHHHRDHQQQGQAWGQRRRGGDGDGVGDGYRMWGGSSDRAGAHGRSRPTTWYIALSNCGSLYGLELHYRMEASLQYFRPNSSHNCKCFSVLFYSIKMHYSELERRMNLKRCAENWSILKIFDVGRNLLVLNILTAVGEGALPEPGRVSSRHKAACISCGGIRAAGVLFCREDRRVIN